MAAIALAGISLLFVVAMVAAWLTDRSPHRLHLIHGASIAYLLIPLAAGAHRSRYGWLIMGFTLFCFLGDILGPGNFLLGAGMFLIAHFFLIPAAIVAGVKRRPLLVATIFYIALTGAVAAYVVPKIPADERTVILPYMAVITAMGAFTGGAWGAHATKVIPIAAFVFYLSDLCLAQTAFLDGGRIFTLTGYPMYYTAVILLALTPATQGKPFTRSG